MTKSALVDRSALISRLVVAALAVAMACLCHGRASADSQSADYRVGPGDTLTSVATAAGVSVSSLVELNGLADPDSLVVGQTLHLRAATPATVGYTVQQGDTLYSIARQYGVSLDILLQINAISDPDSISIGQQLVLPDDMTLRISARLDETPPPISAPKPTAIPALLVSPTLSGAGATPLASPSAAAATATILAAKLLTVPKATPQSLEIGQWIGSPNFWPARPAGQPIAIVIHTASGTLPGMDNWFARSDSDSSAHYGVGLGGDIHQYVKLEDRSWCDGVLEPGNLWPGPSDVQPNELTVNIETEDLGDSHVPVTDDQYDATLQVGRAILARYPQIRFLMTHRSLDPRTRANDPGSRWLDSGRFAALANDLKLVAIP